MKRQRRASFASRAAAASSVGGGGLLTQEELKAPAPIYSMQYRTVDAIMYRTEGGLDTVMNIIRAGMKGTRPIVHPPPMLNWKIRVHVKEVIEGEYTAIQSPTLILVIRRKEAEQNWRQTLRVITNVDCAKPQSDYLLPIDLKTVRRLLKQMHARIFPPGDIAARQAEANRAFETLPRELRGEISAYIGYNRRRQSVTLATASCNM